MLKQRDRGLNIDAGKMTVARWLDYWLENVAAHKLAPSTWRAIGRSSSCTSPPPLRP